MIRDFSKVFIVEPSKRLFKVPNLVLRKAILLLLTIVFLSGCSIPILSPYKLEIKNVDKDICQRLDNIEPCLIINFELVYTGKVKADITIFDASIIDNNGNQGNSLNSFFINKEQCQNGVYNYYSIYENSKNQFSYCFPWYKQEQEPVIFITVRDNSHTYQEKFDLKSLLLPEKDINDMGVNLKLDLEDQNITVKNNLNKEILITLTSNVIYFLDTLGGFKEKTAKIEHPKSFRIGSNEKLSLGNLELCRPRELVWSDIILDCTINLHDITRSRIFGSINIKMQPAYIYLHCYIIHQNSIYISLTYIIS